MGSEERLAETVEHVIRANHPELVVILSGAVSDMVSADVAAVANRFRDDPRCAVIAIEPRCFSRRDRRVRRDSHGNEIPRDYASKDPFGANEPPDCGSNEAVRALIDQLAEQQEITPGLVNAWVTSANWTGGNFCDTGDDFESYSEYLSAVGLTVNLLNTVDGVRRAPAAEFSLADRCRWAMMLHKRYGTGLFKTEDRFFRELCTFDGLREMFMMIAEAAGKRDEMKRELDRRYENLRQRHDEIKAQYGKYRCALYSFNVNIRGQLRAYREDFGFTPAYLIVNFNEDWMRGRGCSEEEISAKYAEFDAEIEEAGYRGVAVNAGEYAAVRQAVQDADLLINGGALLGKYPNDERIGSVKMIASPLVSRPLTFEGRMDVMEASLFMLRNASPNTRGLLQKVEQRRERHGEIEIRNRNALSWWREMLFNERGNS
jgi:nitrogenase molybdenum-iron protein alpha/beta subunit